MDAENTPSDAQREVLLDDLDRVFTALQARGIITRPVKPYGLPEWLRITVGTPAQNERLLSTLAAVIRT